MYARRWGLLSNAKSSDKISIAKRRLKKPCAGCGKPIEKGQKYIKIRRIFDFGDCYWENYHYDCFYGD